jgi:hypothetical protein
LRAVSNIVLKVRTLLAASPESTLPRLEPSRNKPSPLETRRSISAASLGLFDTIRRPVSFSYQRKAGMS